MSEKLPLPEAVQEAIERATHAETKMFFRAGQAVADAVRGIVIMEAKAAGLKPIRVCDVMRILGIALVCLGGQIAIDLAGEEELK